MASKERLNYIITNSGKFVGKPVNISGVVIQADSLEELERKAKTMCRMMLDMLNEMIDQVEPFEMREFKEEDIWLYGEREAEMRRKLKKYEETFGEI